MFTEDKNKRLLPCTANIVSPLGSTGSLHLHCPFSSLFPANHSPHSHGFCERLGLHLSL